MEKIKNKQTKPTQTLVKTVPAGKNDAKLIANAGDGHVVNVFRKLVKIESAGHLTAIADYCKVNNTNVSNLSISDKKTILTPIFDGDARKSFNSLYNNVKENSAPKPKKGVKTITEKLYDGLIIPDFISDINNVNDYKEFLKSLILAAINRTHVDVTVDILRAVFDNIIDKLEQDEIDALIQHADELRAELNEIEKKLKGK